MKKIWFANIPEIFGYGICALHETEEGAIKAVKKSFYKWKDQLPSDSTFESAWEDWGGYTVEVEIGEAYSDNFR